MISFQQYQKYENLQSKYLRTLDFGYIDMEYWLEYAKTAKPLAVYRNKEQMRNHTAKIKKAHRIARDYQAWVRKIEKAESKNPKSTKQKGAKTMATLTRAQKQFRTKLSNLRKQARAIGCVVKAKAGRGKSKNTRYYKKIAKGVYQYELRNR